MKNSNKKYLNHNFKETPHGGSCADSSDRFDLYFCTICKTFALFCYNGKVLPYDTKELLTCEECQIKNLLE